MYFFGDVHDRMRESRKRERDNESEMERGKENEGDSTAFSGTIVLGNRMGVCFCTPTHIHSN